MLATGGITAVRRTVRPGRIRLIRSEPHRRTLVESGRRRHDWMAETAWEIKTRTTIRLEGGPGLEDAPAADIARFIDGVVHAVARAAGHALGRQVRPTGRWKKAVECASEIRLIELRSGSVEFVFASAPDLTEALGLPWYDGSLNERALAIAAEAAGPAADRYPDVAEAWVSLARDLRVGDRYERIRFLADDDREVAVIDETGLATLADAAVREAVTPYESRLQGRLFEANFDARSAQLRGPTGDIVRVEYDDELADDIYRVLRVTANLAGEVSYDPTTMKATSIHVRQIERPVQLGMDDFWSSPSIAQLIHEQGLRPIADPRALVAEGLTASDWEELREAIEA